MFQPQLALAPIQLVDYVVVEQGLTVHPDADYDAEQPDGVALGLGLAVEPTEEGIEIILGMGINEPPPEGADSTQPSNAIYRGRFGIRGHFLWIGADDLTPEEQRKLLVVNGVSALYGIARVHVRQLSEPLPGPPLILPMLSFADALDGLIAAEERNPTA